MIKITGLEVAKYIFENKIPVKVIILSGRKQFDYAKEALDYGVVNYMKKKLQNKLFAPIAYILDIVQNKDTFDEKSDISAEIQILLKDILESFQKNITLEKEILYIKNYMEISRLRFGETLNCHYTVDENLLNIGILKLLLQPLVFLLFAFDFSLTLKIYSTIPSCS